ncbi:MAG: beta-ketoacyl synthase N-terminal-like domain-containing protein [Pirellulaceae bacterium]
MSVTTEKRVVITGLGIVSPLGNDPETLWSNLQAGKSGISTIESLPMAGLPMQAGGEVKDFTGGIEDYGPLDKALQRAIKKNMKVMCREIEMGVAAAQKALAHSGLGPERDADRCGCLFGCDYILTRPEEYADGLRNCRAQSGGRFDIGDWPAHGLPKVNPLWLLKYLPNMPNSHVSIYNDFRGPNNAITVREASMNLSLAEATSIIQRGAADVMLVGATGSRIHPLRTTHVVLTDQLATQRTDPGEMSRPFDVSCDGMVVGEGAGAVMLESYEHAHARGANIWGEIVGHGSAMVGPQPSQGGGAGRDYLREAIRGAMLATTRSAADRLPDSLHIHAHGLSSPGPDTSEALAISDCLERLSDAPVVAAKSYFGNLGAGAGAVELIASLLALKHGQLFPIRNLKELNAAAAWQAATAGTSAGSGFIHNSYTLQGQAACVAIAV